MTSRIIRAAGATLAVGSALAAAQAQAQVHVTGTWSWGTPGNAGQPLDMGSDSTQTCFLVGVKGSLLGVSWQISSYEKAEVAIYQEGGHWKLRTRAGFGTGVSGQAMCISATANRVPIGWAGYPQSPWVSVPVMPNRHCFLTGVSSTVGFDTDKRWAGIIQMGPNWVIKGDLELKQDGTPGGTADGICVDIPAAWSGDGSFWAGTTGTTTSNMGFNGTGKMGCFLQTIGGNFNASTGWEDGVELHLNQATHWFEGTASNGKGANVECVLFK